jgi:hypothetical protein
MLCKYFFASSAEGYVNIVLRRMCND